MNFFDSLSLRSRFLIAPFVGVVLTMVILYSSNTIIQNHTDILKRLNQSNLPQVGEISRTVILLSTNHEQLEELLYSAKDTPDEEKIYLEGRVILDELHSLESQLKIALGNDNKLINGVDVFAKIKESFSNYREQSIRAIELSTLNPKLAENEVRRANIVLRELNDLFMVLSNFYVKNLNQQSEVVAGSLYDKFSLTVLTTSLLVIMVCSALFLSRRMSSQIDRVNDSMISLSNGNTDVDLPELSSKNNNMNQLYKAVYTFHETLEKNEKQQEKLNQTIGELTESKERYSSLLNLVPTAILAINESWEIVLFNQAAEDILGYSSEEVIGESMQMFVPSDYLESYQNYIELIKNSNDEESLKLDQEPLKALKKNGETLYFEASIAKLYVANEAILTIAVTDITRRLKAEKEIRHKAHYDTLTNLPNRSMALSCLNDAIQSSALKQQVLSVLFLDLDGFKKINDTLGHDTGDKLLIEAGKRLQATVGDKGIVARLGGDEFIVVLGGLQSESSAIPSVQNIVEEFREPFKIGDRELILTSSIGIASYPKDGDSTSELLRKADSAMYGAKKSGRNTYTAFTESMNREVSRELALEEQMHCALKREEFRLVYQFQVDLATGEIIGAEALLRWNNHILGEISPDEFIPVAEHTGVIIPLSQFVFKEAVKTLAYWQQTYDKNFRIAVNLSPCQFRDPNIFKFIDETLAENGVAADTVELEITEGVLMSGHSFVDEALKSLSDLGVRLAMDDFGTGYSSLSYLRKYSFDTLKIDRSFVNDIAVGSPNCELVNAIIAMAQALGLEIVAEGIETPMQLEYLALRDCQYGQGYLFKRPIPADEVAQVLEIQKLRTH